MGVSDSGTTQQDQSTGKTPFPWNRVVTGIGPFVAIFSGAVATWLIKHIPGLHIDQATLAANITAAVVFLVGAGGTFAMQHKWLSGWQQWEQSLTDATQIATPDLMPAGHYDPNEFAAPIEGNGQVDSPDANPGTAAPAFNGGMLPPLVDGGFAGGADQSDQSRILPDGQQELASVPGAAADASMSPRPESAMTPDPPIDETEPAEL
jgi:hypothetical protein